MAKWPYNGPWQRIRLKILERDGHTCQIRGRNCTVKATHVDHIVPVEQGGPPYDPANLRAACQRCNVAKRNQLHDRNGWRHVKTRITLVYGPPGAGKSTYVQERRKPGDLVVDYDLIGHALGSDDRHGHQEIHGTINAARNAVLNKIRRGDTGADTVWIISTNPNAVAMFPHHQAVLLDPGGEVSRGRAIEGGRTASALELHDRWRSEHDQLHRPGDNQGGGQLEQGTPRQYAAQPSRDW